MTSREKSTLLMYYEVKFLEYLTNIEIDFCSSPDFCGSPVWEGAVLISQLTNT